MNITRKVEVVSHKAEWKALFLEESEKLKEVFGDEIINIYHIGSTSIPTIYAKPLIDIMVEVADIERIDRYNEQMKQLNYEALGEYGIPKRRFFTKGGDNRTHHVHIFETGDAEIERHLTFRDYMIAHPQEAQSYSLLKQELAKKFPENMDGYIKGKDSFIKNIDRKAVKWRKGETE
ncbi:GrpB family protein [Bacillus sp. AGMB 02131]|uniref:GrpB family protein n=1 Tax=Peribacillus faecalis TaxID=2772559 RepID=A0A927CWQ3_9BACI|nr:GrpB family protein [Peribacillus faecalis]MBD3109157.1 GrpB family protein [Peribacillus faecalis]